MGKRLSKDIASFDYFDKSLIALSATSGTISIASFAIVIASASFSFAFAITAGVVKKYTKNNTK